MGCYCVFSTSCLLAKIATQCCGSSQQVCTYIGNYPVFFGGGGGGGGGHCMGIFVLHHPDTYLGFSQVVLSTPTSHQSRATFSTEPMQCSTTQRTMVRFTDILRPTLSLLEHSLMHNASWDHCDTVLTLLPLCNTHSVNTMSQCYHCVTHTHNSDNTVSHTHTPMLPL